MSEGDTLEMRITAAGDALLRQFSRVLAQVPGSDLGPQRLAGELGVDKVLASRLLKAVRAPDPIAVVHRVPGPEPLRRVLRASAKVGVNADDLAQAHAAVDGFEELIRSEIGDRSALEAILAAWVPEARRDFEVRRKQAAFRAMSQLKGVQADVYAEAAFFHPTADGERIDVVWLKAAIGLQRLRPGVRVRFTSRRAVEAETDGRQPLNLAGEPVAGASGAVLPEFCTSPAPTLSSIAAGEMMHYMLADPSFGASSAVNLVTCEVNRSELPRYVSAAHKRRAWASSEVDFPAKRLQFDAFVHEDLYPESDPPSLVVYDTAVRGLADVNDPIRDIDRMDLLESIDPLGRGIPRFGSSDVPRYRDMLEAVCTRLGYDGGVFRGYRCRSDYPIYGAQFAMTFRPESAE